MKKSEKEQKKPTDRSGSLRILRAYAVTVVLILCLCVFSCGVLIAQNNTRRLGLGEEQARVVLSQKEERLVLQARQLEFDLQTQMPVAADSLLRFSPPPLSALYWFVQCVAELVSS